MIRLASIPDHRDDRKLVVAEGRDSHLDAALRDGARDGARGGTRLSSGQVEVKEVATSLPDVTNFLDNSVREIIDAYIKGLRDRLKAASNKMQEKIQAVNRRKSGDTTSNQEPAPIKHPEWDGAMDFVCRFARTRIETFQTILNSTTATVQINEARYPADEVTKEEAQGDGQTEEKEVIPESCLEHLLLCERLIEIMEKGTEVLQQTESRLAALKAEIDADDEDLVTASSRKGQLSLPGARESFEGEKAEVSVQVNRLITTLGKNRPKANKAETNSSNIIDVLTDYLTEKPGQGVEADRVLAENLLTRLQPYANGGLSNSDIAQVLNTKGYREFFRIQIPVEVEEKVREIAQNLVGGDDVEQSRHGHRVLAVAQWAVPSLLLLIFLIAHMTSKGNQSTTAMAEGQGPSATPTQMLYGRGTMDDDRYQIDGAAFTGDPAAMQVLVDRVVVAEAWRSPLEYYMHTLGINEFEAERKLEEDVAEALSKIVRTRGFSVVDKDQSGEFKLPSGHRARYQVTGFKYSNFSSPVVEKVLTGGGYVTETAEFPDSPSIPGTADIDVLFTVEAEGLEGETGYATISLTKYRVKIDCEPVPSEGDVGY